jgi:hypothetical protein
MEFAQRRVESVQVRGICGPLLRIALTLAAEVHHEQNDDDADRDECGNDDVHVYDCACRGFQFYDLQSWRGDQAMTDQ